MFASSQKSYASGYLELLIKGIYLEKINSRYSKDLYKFQVDEKGIFLRYQKASRFNWSKQDDSGILEVAISEIKEIRKGAQTDVFCEVFKGEKRQIMESLCCSLLLSDGKTLNLRTNREEVRNAFFECLHYLKNRQSRDLWYKEQFLKADKNRDNFLSIKEIVQLLNQLNIDVDEFYAALLLQKKSLDLDEFIELLRRLQSRKSIEEIFRKYAGDKDSLSAEDLHKIFTEQQQENKSLSECEDIINSFEGYQKYRAQKCLTMDGFHQLFNSKFFDIFNYKYSSVYQDMNQPITHYFIDSSHNTYLEGGQINSYSRVECYINVLRAGCRCVEIDVWDGSDNDPVVTHGYAGTTKLLFSDVIDAVDKTAFCSSKYPVILSLENHCNAEQQRKMAKIMKDIFKDKIFVGPISEELCPSPEQLIGKIIVKCKKSEMLRSSSSVELDDTMGEYDSVDAKQKPLKIAKELSDLVVICQPAKFSSFQHSAISHNFKNVCSLDENKAKNLAQANLQEFTAHNMRILSRIYPSGTRIKSSNYDPTIFWLSGCQLVALNHQTSKQPMFLNRGMFSDNGGCGYILKPKYQRNLESLKEFSEPTLLQHRRNYFVTIIDGFSLPKKPKDSINSILDPYVIVRTIGVPEDCHCFKTEVIKNNGFNPVWNHKISFSLQHPEISLILFEVHDYEKITDNVLVAQRCFRMETLMPGYRMVHLKSAAGEVLLSNLLIHVSFE